MRRKKSACGSCIMHGCSPPCTGKLCVTETCTYAAVKFCIRHELQGAWIRLEPLEAPSHFHLYFCSQAEHASSLSTRTTCSSGPQTGPHIRTAFAAYASSCTACRADQHTRGAITCSNTTDLTRLKLCRAVPELIAAGSETLRGAS